MFGSRSLHRVNGA